MYLRNFSKIIVIATAIVNNCRAEDDKQRVLGLSDSTYLQRPNLVRKKEQDAAGLNHIRKRALESANTQLFYAATKAFNLDDDCCTDNVSSDNLSSTPSIPSATAIPSVTASTTPSLNPTLRLSVTPSTIPTQNPTFAEKKFTASDGVAQDKFGYACSISEDLVVFGAESGPKGLGGVYQFNLDGTEIQKLTPNNGNDWDFFGRSVSMDEKVVVGSNWGGYVQVFSRAGIFERTLTCGSCTQFGRNVATLGNLIVTNGIQNSIRKLFIQSTEDGQLLKTLEQDGDYIHDVDISENYIVSTGSKTYIYSNSSPDFPEIAEIDKEGYKVAVADERLVIGDYRANSYDGAAWLYDTDGAIVTALDRQDASSGSEFGWSVAITDDKVLVGAWRDDDGGNEAGSAYIYSAVTGEFIEKVLAPEGDDYDWFGSSLCASNSYFVVGAYRDDGFTGAAYLFRY